MRPTTLQHAAQWAGIADVFSRTGAQAEPLPTLHQSLLGGTSCVRNGKRPSACQRDGEQQSQDGSPCLRQAHARTAQLQALVSDATDKARLVTRLADTLGTTGTFSGYV